MSVRISGPTVPDVTGKTEAEATQAIQNAGFVVGTVTREYSETVSKDHVIRTEPAAGTESIRGAKINLVISSGDEVTVPDVVGWSEGDAVAELLNKYLLGSSVVREFNNAVAKGLVISTSPVKDTKVKIHTTVTVIVSRGPEIVVPNVIGQDVDTAIATLTSHGLVVTVVEVEDGDPRDNIVDDQSPGGGTSVEAGTEVTLYISKGPVEP